MFVEESLDQMSPCLETANQQMKCGQVDRQPDERYWGRMDVEGDETGNATLGRQVRLY